MRDMLGGQSMTAAMSTLLETNPLDDEGTVVTFVSSPGSYGGQLNRLDDTQAEFSASQPQFQRVDTDLTSGTFDNYVGMTAGEDPPVFAMPQNHMQYPAYTSVRRRLLLAKK